MDINILTCMPALSRDPRFQVTPAEGSVKERCNLCHTEMWMGIKQQQYRKEHPETLAICLVCAAIMSKEERDKVNLISLGGESATVTIDGEPLQMAMTQEEADQCEAWVCMPASKPSNLSRCLKDRCTRCGQEVWYDPDMAIKTKAPKICIPCSVESLKEDSLGA